MAPLSVIDYIVVHELAHVKEKNHSPKFWKIVGDNLAGPSSSERLAEETRVSVEYLNWMGQRGRMNKEQPSAGAFFHNPRKLPLTP